MADFGSFRADSFARQKASVSTIIWPVVPSEIVTNYRYKVPMNFTILFVKHWFYVRSNCSFAIIITNVGNWISIWTAVCRQCSCRLTADTDSDRTQKQWQILIVTPHSTVALIVLTLFRGPIMIIITNIGNCCHCWQWHTLSDWSLCLWQRDTRSIGRGKGLHNYDNISWPTTPFRVLKLKILWTSTQSFPVHFPLCHR